jgi:hypothetical protein
MLSAMDESRKPSLPPYYKVVQPLVDENGQLRRPTPDEVLSMFDGRARAQFNLVMVDALARLLLPLWRKVFPTKERDDYADWS